MDVKLVAVTAGAGEEHAGRSAEDIMVFAARVSNPKNQRNFDTASRLLKYCVDHGHWSVFETAHMTVEITTSRAIASQLLRHRSATFQQFSQRYAASHGYVPAEARQQGPTNRQSSTDTLDAETKEWFEKAQGRVWGLASMLYEDALASGVAKECARFLLPLNTATTLFMTMSVRGWIHYIQVRSGEDTQKEHRDIALKIKHIFAQQFPNVASALLWVV